MSDYIKQLEEQNRELQNRLAVAEEENETYRKFLFPSWGPTFIEECGKGLKYMREYRHSYKKDTEIVAYIYSFVIENISQKWYCDINGFPANDHEFDSEEDAKQFVETFYKNQLVLGMKAIKGV